MLTENGQMILVRRCDLAGHAIAKGLPRSRGLRTARVGAVKAFRVSGELLGRSPGCSIEPCRAPEATGISPNARQPRADDGQRELLQENPAG